MGACKREPDGCVHASHEHPLSSEHSSFVLSSLNSERRRLNPLASLRSLTWQSASIRIRSLPFQLAVLNARL